ncbi:MAG: hypothetical protein Ta2D_07390 [Rickettsiales bacterium]|nr:MAG: hypothetical protein Ta2D_07390 [Rickettsiales bacterium]
MSDNMCVFCDKEKMKDGFLYETENFFVRSGVGVVCMGHILIVSKQHFKAMAEMPSDIVDEYENLKNMFVKKVENTFKKPFLIEYGVFGQSVFHAHTHIIPTIDDIDFFSQVINPYIQKSKNILHKMEYFEELQKFYIKKGKYTYYEFDNKKYFIELKNEVFGVPNYRDFFTELGISGCANWEEMEDQDKIIDKITRKQTMKMLEFL